MEDDGYAALVARLHLIRHAGRSIDIQTFTWHFDETCGVLARELVAAAERGVRVRLLVDHIGADWEPGAMAWLATAHPNIEVKVYRPLTRVYSPAVSVALGICLANMRDGNQRMHDKLFLVDGAVGITGGRNWGDSYFNASRYMLYRDRDALVVGPVVTGMTASFQRFWNAPMTVPTREFPMLPGASQAEVTIWCRHPGLRRWRARLPCGRAATRRIRPGSGGI